MEVEQLEQRWCPSYTLVTSRAALAGTDFVNWGALVPPGTSPANPFTILSTGGRSISVSQKSGRFDLKEQTPWPTPSVVGPWDGNFAPGDIVLWANNFSSQTNPITLNFGTTAVAAGGAQIQPLFGNGSAFTAKVEALDANGKTLASFTEAGINSRASDNSAIFIGISSGSPTIYKIAVSLTSVTNGYRGYPAINRFDFRTSAVAAAPAISQPASAIDLALLASSLLSSGQPAMRTAPIAGFAGPFAPPASQSGVVPTSETTSAVHVEATDAVFAVSYAAASDDNAWFLAPLSFSSFDGI